MPEPRLAILCSLSVISSMFLLCGCASGQDSPRGVVERQIERTVRVRVEVERVESSLRSLRQNVQQRHGFVVSATVVRDDRVGDSVATLEARVPVRDLGDFRATIAALGDVKTEEETAADVTAQVVDRDARLRNARALELRLLSILDRAATVTDVMAVEAQLGSTRERIEVMQAEGDAQRERIDFALVTVDLGAHPVAFWERPGRSIAGAAETGIHLVAFLAVGLASTVAALGPSALIFIALVALLVWGLRMVGRRRSVAR